MTLSHIQRPLTPQEVADYLQLPVTWVYAQVRKGKIKKLKGTGKYVRIDPAWLEAYLSGSKKSSLKIKEKTSPRFLIKTGERLCL